jgi:hypothetical protein
VLFGRLEHGGTAIADVVAGDIAFSVETPEARAEAQAPATAGLPA